MRTGKNKEFCLGDFSSFAAPGSTTWEGAGGDNSLDRRRYLIFARNAVDFLPPKQSEAVTLYFVEGLRIPAIARELGVSASTVSRRLSAARKTLRSLGDLYRRSGFFPA